MTEPEHLGSGPAAPIKRRLPGNSRNWVKGMPSPNPGGRLKGVPQMIAAAINQAVKIKGAGKDEEIDNRSALFVLFKTLAEIMVDPKAKPGEKQAAAVELLNRWIGKPVERTLNLNMEAQQNDTARILSDPRGADLIAELERLAAGEIQPGGTRQICEQREVEAVPSSRPPQSQAP